MNCPLSTYAELPVRVTFFTPCCHQGMCAYQGVGNVAFGEILQMYYMDVPLVCRIIVFH